MRKSLKLLAIGVFFALCGLHSLSAEPLDFKNSVGVYGLYDTKVLGIQYQRWCTDRIGFQTEGFVYYQKGASDTDANDYEFSLSGEFQFKLFETPFGKRSASIIHSFTLG